MEYVCEVADNTIYDNKKRLCDLEITILDEKTNMNDLKKKTTLVQQKQIKKDEENKLKIEDLKKQRDDLQNKQGQYLKQFEGLFLMIKQEQLLGKEIKSRSKLLENTIQDIQHFMLGLDQLYLTA